MRVRPSDSTHPENSLAYSCSYTRATPTHLLTRGTHVAEGGSKFPPPSCARTTIHFQHGEHKKDWVLFFSFFPSCHQLTCPISARKKTKNQKSNPKIETETVNQPKIKDRNQKSKIKQKSRPPNPPKTGFLLNSTAANARYEIIALPVRLRSDITSHPRYPISRLPGRTDR
jgi:hypothetical protein